jgi:transketolase
VCNNEPLDKKFEAFGWDVRIVDGHDYAQLDEALTPAKGLEKPRVVIANTIKGKGVSFMQDVVKWHHGVPSDAEYATAMKELEAAHALLSGGQHP